MFQKFSHRSKNPITNVTRNKHLRNLISAIGYKYGPEGFNPYHVNISRYEGLAYNNDKELSDILVKIFNNEYPAIFDSYITQKIKNRPTETKVIYFTGDFLKSRAFTEAGFELIKEKEVDVVLGLKKKKVLGKPAVSDGV